MLNYYTIVITGNLKRTHLDLENNISSMNKKTIKTGKKNTDKINEYTS